jgi:hypothetical protein
LVKLIERAQSYGMNIVESIKNRYHEHIGFCAFMVNRNKIEEKLEPEDGKLLSMDQIEMVKSADLENAGETVCGIISDFFEYIKTETQED